MGLGRFVVKRPPRDPTLFRQGLGCRDRPRRADRWLRRVQLWVAQEGTWFHHQLTHLPGVLPMPSSANYLLLRGVDSLLELRERVAQRGVLLRDCRSFTGLGEDWLRIGLQDRRGNLRILRALKQELR